MCSHCMTLHVARHCLCRAAATWHEGARSGLGLHRSGGCAEAWMFISTVQVGLRVLQEDGRVFACYTNILDTVFHAEVGASAAVLAANFAATILLCTYVRHIGFLKVIFSF